MDRNFEVEIDICYEYTLRGERITLQNPYPRFSLWTLKWVAPQNISALTLLCSSDIDICDRVIDSIGCTNVVQVSISRLSALRARSTGTAGFPGSVHRITPKHALACKLILLEKVQRQRGCLLQFSPGGGGKPESLW